MTKKQIVALVIGIVVLVVCASLAIWLFLMPQWQKEPDSNEKMTYTVQVENASGAPISDVGIYIYTDETMVELVWFDRTNEQGQMSFTDKKSDRYVAVLADVPTGYAAEAYYRLSGELTKIVLAVGSMADVNPDEVKYELGDVMMDFSVTTPDGMVYTLAELLKEKRAVVLNFWYIECGPCGMEFPFMQEAYEEYKDQIEILALNPINQDDAAIAAYQKEKGITFPMAKIDPVWEKMMGLTAYPTTVVIDRFGNISLIHKGSIDNADTFRQLFKYFTADDYEQKAILSIDEIVTEVEGSEDNPLQTGSNGADVTVKAGEEYYLEFYKVSGMYMQVKGEGNDFYVMYKDKKYTPTNGIVGMMVESDGIYYPVKITIGNTSKKDQSFAIDFSALKGTIGNPYTMYLGEFNVSTNAGNEQGVFYTHTAEKDGTLTVKCLSSSVSKYGFFLYNLRSYAMRNTDEDGKVDEDGCLSVSVAVKKGDTVQFSVAVMRNEANYISAGSFRFLAEMDEGEVEEEVKKEAEKTTYTVTVTDEAGTPVSGVVVNVKGNFIYTYPDTEGENKEEQTGTTESGEEKQPETEKVKADLNLTTDEKGVVTTEQISGPYTATVRVPDGYRLAKTQYELTAEAPSVTVKLQKIIMKNYTVKVVYADGTPVKDIAVMIGSTFQYTDAEGKVVFNLEEGSYTANVMNVPAGYDILTGNSATFPAASAEVTFTLTKRGVQENPISVKKFPYVTDLLGAGESAFVQFSYESTPVLTIEDADAAVTMDGVTHKADPETGVLQIPMAEGDPEKPVTLSITNNGTAQKSFTVKLVYPEGSKWNPIPIENLNLITVTLAEGDEDGCYYQYTNGKGGTVTLEEFMAMPADVLYKLTLSSETDPDTAFAENAFAEKEAKVYVKYGESAVLFAQAVPVEETVEEETEGAEGTEDSESTEGTEDTEGAEGTEGTGETEDTKEPEIVIKYPAVTIYLTGSFEEDPNALPPESEEDTPIDVPEGKTLYTVTITDYSGVPVSDLMVQFLKDGNQVGGGLSSANGKAYAALEEGSYSVALASTGGTKYYYESLQAMFAAGQTTLELKVTAMVPGEAEEHWSLGSVQKVSVGGTYLSMQKDLLNYYVITPTEPGVYRFTTSNPNAVISYWGAETFPSDQTASTDYADNAFTREIQVSGVGQTHVIGVTGAEDCILVITRIGDAKEEVPDEIYEAKTPPVAFTFTMPAGKSFTFVDLKGKTEDYQVAYNETDGFYHLGTASGPVLYVQLKDNVVDSDNPVAPPYVPLFRMVGGMNDNTGTALRGTYEKDGVEVRQDYTSCVLEYGNCADATYGVYPLTEDLVYILQNGGKYQGWWDTTNAKGNLLFKDDEGNLDTSYNLELGWMFAVCYIQ